MLALAAAAAFAAVTFAHGQNRGLPRIGFLGLDSAMQSVRTLAFVDELRKLGYVDGKNIVIEYRWAEGHFDRLPQLAAELVAAKVNIIVTAAPPAVAAARGATKTIPIIMTAHNPVGAGYAASLAHPGGNVTGVAFQDAELSTKRLVHLKDAVPNLRRVAVLWHRAGQGGTDTVEVVESAAKELGLETRAFEVREVTDFAKAVQAATAWGAQALLQVSAPFITLNRKVMIAELSAQKMPATCELREYVADGCLMTYSADLNALFRQMAPFVDRILRGANPADLAIEQPREFQFVINRKTADMLGLKIPRSLEYQMTEGYL
jgi:putative ABC transport system substrate-binding protein